MDDFHCSSGWVNAFIRFCFDKFLTITSELERFLSIIDCKYDAYKFSIPCFTPNTSFAKLSLIMSTLLCAKKTSSI